MCVKIIRNEDIFSCDAQTIVNTVNCVGVMGKGIAKKYKKLYPDMFERYVLLCNQGLINVGKLWLYKSEDKWILNFPTKTHWKYPSEISYLEKGLKKFIDTYEEKGLKSVAFPLLGASNGKIPPEVSLKIMIRYLKNCKIPVYIFIRDFNIKE